jgi:hypothetical protein
MVSSMFFSSKRFVLSTNFFSLAIAQSNSTDIPNKFENFTVEWHSLHPLACAVSSVLTHSSFSCLPLTRYTVVISEMVCLSDIVIDFNPNSCLITTTQSPISITNTSSVSIVPNDTNNTTYSIHSTIDLNVVLHLIESLDLSARCN